MAVVCRPAYNQVQTPQGVLVFLGVVRAVMLDMQQMIEDTLSDLQADIEAIDLYQVATVLRPLFPAHSMSELTRTVAEVAVQNGHTSLIWDPPGH